MTITGYLIQHTNQLADFCSSQLKQESVLTEYTLEEWNKIYTAWIEAEKKSKEPAVPCVHVVTIIISTYNDQNYIYYQTGVCNKCNKAVERKVSDIIFKANQSELIPWVTI